jgi:hypothetical protein
MVNGVIFNVDSSQILNLGFISNAPSLMAGFIFNGLIFGGFIFNDSF